MYFNLIIITDHNRKEKLRMYKFGRSILTPYEEKTDWRREKTISEERTNNSQLKSANKLKDLETLHTPTT